MSLDEAMLRIERNEVETARKVREVTEEAS
jgi:hypothetical protein